MPPEIREDLCPLCGQPNACEAKSADRCWCADITIPAGLLAQIPPESQRKTCVCRACVNAWKTKTAGD